MKTFHKVLLYFIIGFLVLCGCILGSLYGKKELDYRITDVRVYKVSVPDTLFRVDCFYRISIYVKPVNYRHGFMIGGAIPYTKGSVDSIENIQLISKELSQDNQFKCIKTIRGETCNRISFKGTLGKESIKCYHDIKSLKKGMEDGIRDNFTYLV